jgi:hypothetical protein
MKMRHVDMVRWDGMIGTAGKPMMVGEGSPQCQNLLTYCIEAIYRQAAAVAYSGMSLFKIEVWYS